ncbi:MAG: hypothetical protein ACI4UW_01015, partial [Muribaculaceae bacterium]
SHPRNATNIEPQKPLPTATNTPLQKPLHQHHQHSLKKHSPNATNTPPQKPTLTLPPSTASKAHYHCHPPTATRHCLLV